MGLADIHSTEWMLEEWARWARAGNGLSLYYPSTEPYERLRGSSLPSASLTDDEGAIVDAVVTELVKAHKAEGDAVALFYLVTQNYARLEKLMREHGHAVDRRRMSDLIRAGVMWLDGRITY